MKAAKRWMACETCGILRDHIRDTTTQLTPFDVGQVAEAWICAICGTSRLMARHNSDQEDREQLESRGQLRLID
ncbi:hypothetical protein ACPPTR_06155 [Ralstonia pseudosolanacearum]|uniref:hypothetical protein n=1 Tax=Ralstonia pseudosolanacearum TaxID=1310165 RepID=UPI000B92DF47|nr:hypothetical protein [Ralstonia pseudosolanacearum]MCD9230433.1 hypothetical protein [Ralstonia pseudosolanacearum]